MKDICVFFFCKRRYGKRKKRRFMFFLPPLTVGFQWGERGKEGGGGYERTNCAWMIVHRRFNRTILVASRAVFPVGIFFQSACFLSLHSFSPPVEGLEPISHFFFAFHQLKLEIHGSPCDDHHPRRLKIVTLPQGEENRNKLKRKSLRCAISLRCCTIDSPSNHSLRCQITKN